MSVDEPIAARRGPARCFVKAAVYSRTVTRINTTDEFYIAVPPQLVYHELVDAARIGAWWPGARVRSSARGIELRAPSFRRVARPVRFAARADGHRPGEGFTWWLEEGELRGRAEWWLEAFKDGTIVHYYLDVERGTGGRARRMSSSVRRHRWAVRRGVNALKDRLENRT
jgi:uncharacterized protein YndB with AHSA1/START domain